jgi:hypothetical protein
MSQSIGDAVAEIRTNQRKLLMLLGGGGGGMSTTEVNSTAILNILTSGIDLKLDVLLDSLTGVRIPSYDIVTAAGASLAGLKSISVANTGLANGVFLTKTLKPGQSLSFNAEGGEFSANAFTWNALGTEFLITTIYR